MTKIFQNKVVLITGGNSGIGKACALSFAKEGAVVVIAARRSEEAEIILNEIKNEGGNGIFIKTDLSHTSEIKNLFIQISDIYGRLDCAVNNAGIEGTPFTITEDYSEEVWNDVININLKAVWLCMKYEIPLMLKNGGTIINISSFAGLRASMTAGAPYTASKHGVVGLTKSVALEYAKKGLRVNAVCPAIIHTPMADQILGDKVNEAGAWHPIGRVGAPQEVADAVMWLASEKSSFVTGIALSVDGGLQA